MPEFNNYNKVVKHPVYFIPCEIGMKVKVYLSQELDEWRCTYGKVIALDDYQTPIIKYFDLSSLKLHEFSRMLLRKDVILTGRFKEHVIWSKKKEEVIEDIGLA